MACATHIDSGFEIAGRLRSRGEFYRQFRAGPHCRPLRVLDAGHSYSVALTNMRLLAFMAEPCCRVARHRVGCGSAFDDRQSLEEKETTPMSNKLAIVLACGLLGSLLAFNVQAFPVSSRAGAGGNAHRDAGARLLRAQFPPRPRRLLRAQRRILDLSAGAGAAPGGGAARLPVWLLTSVRTAAALRRWRAPTAITSVDTANAFHTGGRNCGRNRVEYCTIFFD